MGEAIADVLKRSGEWLLADQQYVPGKLAPAGWADLPGKPASVLNTAEALLAIIKSSTATAGDARVKAAADFLVAHQVSAGDDVGCWPRVVTPDDPAKPPKVAPDLVRTCLVLEALLNVGGQDGPVDAALAWLGRVQNEDGGWAFRRGVASSVMPTCFALSALLEAKSAGKPMDDDRIGDGVDLLAKGFRKPTGAFGPEGRMEAVQTMHAALVLAGARRCKLNSYPDYENDALNWLLKNPKQARSSVEGSIDIDADPDPDTNASYGFSYMTDALLVRVLAGSPDDKHRSSKTLRNALVSLDSKREADGGFFGERVFSWSTAKAVHALCSARDVRGELPDVEPEVTGLSARKVLVPTLIGLGALMLVLSLAGAFGAVQLAFAAMLLLAALLGVGLIKEQTFKELVSSALGRDRSGSGGA